MGGNDEREQTLNQLLTEMDGFEENNGQGEINALQRCDRGAYPNQVKITDEVSLPK